MTSKSKQDEADTKPTTDEQPKTSSAKRAEAADSRLPGAEPVQALADDVRVEKRASGEVYHEARAEQGSVEDSVRIKNLDGAEPDAFTKQFVLPKRDFGAGYDHTPNFTGTSQEAVNIGLRLTGDVEYVGSEPHVDGESVVLTYRVPVLPAWHEDAPVNVVDAQEVWRDGVTPADERTPVDAEQVAPRTGDARYSEAGEDPKRVREGGKPAEGSPAAAEQESGRKQSSK